jgi:tungstate transport system ATP-binding protein
VFSAPSDNDVASFVGVETVIAGVVIVSQNGQLIVDAKGLQLEAVGEFPNGRPVWFCLRPEDITLSTSDGGVISSARNRLNGHITHMTPSGPLVRVIVDCGLPIVALITRGSAHDMKLMEGQAITVSFKATAVHLIPR